MSNCLTKDLDERLQRSRGLSETVDWTDGMEGGMGWEGREEGRAGQGGGEGRGGRQSTDGFSGL